MRNPEMQTYKAYYRFSEPKTEKFCLSEILRYQPNGITLEHLKKMASKYNKPDLYKLINYLSEWTAEYNPLEKSCIDIINIALSQRFYNESRNLGSMLKPELSSFEIYISHAFKNYKSAPEIFMEYLLGWEKLGIIKKRMESRTIEEKIEFENKIKEALSKNN